MHIVVDVVVLRKGIEIRQIHVQKIGGTHWPEGGHGGDVRPTSAN